MPHVLNFVFRVFFKLDKETRLFFGLPYRLHSEDRKILDRKLLPWFAARNDVKKVLFVGCDSYTVHYKEYFLEDEYWTLEPDPLKKKFGSRNHIIGQLEDLANYVSENYFDLIICNGIYGWGLDEKEAIEKAFTSCYNCLGNNGFLILGWNNLPERTLVPLSNIKALHLFTPFEDLAIGGPTIITQTKHKHIFDLYRVKKKTNIDY